MGNDLTKTVIEATGLPTDPVERELNGLIAKHGTTPEEMTLDDLRDIMAEYLQTVFLELAQEEENSVAS
jgi:hypothetical protein